MSSGPAGLHPASSLLLKLLQLLSKSVLPPQTSCSYVAKMAWGFGFRWGACRLGPIRAAGSVGPSPKCVGLVSARNWPFTPN